MKFKEVLIISPSTSRRGGIASVLKIYRESFTFNFFPSTFFQKTSLSFFFFPERMLSLILLYVFNKKIKIVHIHGSSEGSFYRKYILFRISRFFRKKIIFHLHSGRFVDFYLNSNERNKKKIEFMMTKSQAIIVLSDSWKQKIYNTFSPKSIYVVPNIIQRPIAKKNISPYKKKILNVVFLGKIFQPKGIYDLLDCINENKNEFYDKFRFYIAGEGEEHKLEQYKKKDTHSILSFLGWVGGEEKSQVMINSDILILPSYSEGSPISILEAMSYKMPIIATNVGGIPELVSNGINGVLIEPGNKKDIHNALLYYYNNVDKLTEHGENSFKKVQKHFPEQVGGVLQHIYESI